MRCATVSEALVFASKIKRKSICRLWYDTFCLTQYCRGTALYLYQLHPALAQEVDIQRASSSQGSADVLGGFR